MNNLLFKRYPTADEPIILSLMDVDFYKFTMGQFIWKRYRGVQVRFAFKCRTKGVSLAKVIPESALRAELDHVMTLRFNNSELHYLRGTNEYGERMFSEGYLQFLKGLSLPQYDLRYVGNEIELWVDEEWAKDSHWETIMLSIVNELYYRFKLATLSRFEREAVNAEGIRRLHEKIKILKANPQIVFSDFGTRRRFSRTWQDYVNAVISEELPVGTQFRGTSSTYLAMKHGLLPMGTNAHELQMVMAALAPRKPGALIASQQRMLKQWWQDYGEGLSVFLPDTFGTESFLRHLSPKMAADWKGPRLDSGDPNWETNLWLKYYKRHGINSKEKLVTPSDGLELPFMLDFHREHGKRVRIGYGWGSGLMNDMGLDPVSIVVKATRANGRATVKLSNNPGKGMSDDLLEMDRYKKEFKYGHYKRIATKY